MPYPSRTSSQLNKKTASVLIPPTVAVPGARGYTRYQSSEAIAAQTAFARGNTVGPAVGRGARPPATAVYSKVEVDAINKTFGKTPGTVNKKRKPKPPAQPKLPGNTPPDTYKFNLPPHAWSLPVRPAEVLRNGMTDDGIFVNNNPLGNSIHRERRGLIWHWDDGGLVSTVDSETLEVVTSETEQKNKDKEKASKLGGSNKKNEYDYGFQFLWNPETIQQNIERNMDVTPSSADRFRSVAGAFPGQETYSFTITLDRVNDFACIKEWGNNPAKLPFFIDNYYKHGYGEQSATGKLQKLKDLAKYGTMADLEYLFKALNGTGRGSNPDPKFENKTWTTLLGKPTANIGFLSPSLLAFRLGPDATTSLSFVGWITSLNINHIMFTETMIPLRTTVSFSCAAFAGSTIA